MRKKIIDKAKDGSLKVTNGEAKAAPKKRGRWDQAVVISEDVRIR